MLRSYLYVGIAIAALAVVIGAFGVGVRMERGAAESRMREQLVEQITERGKIDEAVKDMSADDVCRKLDGVWRDGKCE